jgi:hypothetical protein
VSRFGGDADATARRKFARQRVGSSDGSSLMEVVRRGVASGAAPEWPQVERPSEQGSSKNS